MNIRKATFNRIAFCVLIILFLQEADAQTTWNLAGNSNANLNSKFGTINAIPLKITTKNLTRVYIDTSGKVGIGSSKPDKAGLVVNAVTGNTNAIFGENTTGVSLVSNWPGIGFNTYYNKKWLNMANGFSGIISLNQLDGSMEFYNTSDMHPGGASTPLVNRLHIGANGFVGIGTTTPGAQLDLGDPGGNEGLRIVKSLDRPAVDLYTTYVYSVAPTLNVANDGWGDAIVASSAKGSGLYAENGSSTTYAVFINGSVYSTGHYQTSDEKLKQNIRSFSSALNIINELHPKVYQYKKDGNYASMHLPGGDHYGLIAQDVEKVLPNLVKQTSFDTRITKHNADFKKSSSEDTVNFKALNYTELIPILIQGIQEQQATINKLTQLVQQLQNSVSSGMRLDNSTHIKEDFHQAILYQNEPNPAHQNTRIQYFLPFGSSHAMLMLTDEIGHTVRQFPLQGPGKGVIEIQTSELSSGNYYYTLLIDEKKVDTKKLLVVR